MPLYRTYKKGDLRVGVWKVEETIDQLRSKFNDFSLYESGLRKFKAEKRQLEWLAVRVLLKELLGEEKVIDYLPSGKPLLKDRSAYISFSHTCGYVAIAVHPTKEVGIDIEQYGNRVSKLASRFVREDESVSVKAGDAIYALLLHWSAKETMFKLMNQSDVDFLEHLHILPFVPSESGDMEAVEYRTDLHQTFQIRYCIHPDYVMTFSCLE
jgi:phosphopantetheinyl transferase